MEKIEIRDIRDGGFLWIDKNALEKVSDNLGPNGIAVYAWLCYYANAKNQGCFPSISTLHKKSGVRQKTVMQIIKDLEKIMVIAVYRENGKNSQYNLLDISTSGNSATGGGSATGGSSATPTSGASATAPVAPAPLEQELSNNNKLTIINKEQSSIQAKFLESFATLYENQTGHPFKADKKHFVIISTLIKKYGYEAAVQKAMLLSIYCHQAEVWFAREGWSCFTPETLSTHWNRIIPILSEEQKKAKKSEEIYQKLKEDRRKADELVKNSMAS